MGALFFGISVADSKWSCVWDTEEGIPMITRCKIGTGPWKELYTIWVNGRMDWTGVSKTGLAIFLLGLGERGRRGKSLYKLILECTLGAPRRKLFDRRRAIKQEMHPNRFWCSVVWSRNTKIAMLKDSKAEGLYLMFVFSFCIRPMMTEGGGGVRF